MSARVSLCLIWILYGYSWRSFFKILGNDVQERLGSWERLQRGFFRLLPTESLTTSILSGHLAINFLPDLRFSASSLRLFIDSVTKDCVLNDKFGFSGDIVIVKLPAKICLHSTEWFFSPNKFWRKIFFLSCPRHSDRGLIVDIVYYFQIWNKIEHNIISSRVISSHVGPMYIETPYIWPPSKMFILILKVLLSYLKLSTTIFLFIILNTSSSVTLTLV